MSTVITDDRNSSGSVSKVCACGQNCRGEFSNRVMITSNSAMATTLLTGVQLERDYKSVRCPFSPQSSRFRCHAESQVLQEISEEINEPLTDAIDVRWVKKTGGGLKRGKQHCFS